MSTLPRLDRRSLLIRASVLAALGTFEARPSEAQDDAVIESLSEVPSTGARRLGPIALAAKSGGTRATRGETPVAIRIPKAGVDASVERLDIVGGVMPNPSGPWVVSWYHDLATLGRRDNVVMAGHVDYWDVGPAVFWNLSQLVPGDRIDVISEKDDSFSYAVEWMQNYVVAEMAQEDFDEMLGDAGGEALTLITCAIGTWDEATQEYRERTVLRAMQV